LKDRKGEKVCLREKRYTQRKRKNEEGKENEKE
jgi:hypothetical protein